MVFPLVFDRQGEMTMLHGIMHDDATGEAAALRAMFEARKHVFIDLLKWDLHAVAGRFEIDQFDDEHSRYLVLLDPSGAHRASARLLRTTSEHILGDLYPHLVAGPVPRDPSIVEITRFCLDRQQTSGERRSARNQLVSALADHALAHGITAYTGVADVDWFEQIRRFGWRCEALGQPVSYGAHRLVGLHIAIEPDTIARLADAGIYEPPSLTLVSAKLGELQ